ncbi:MAG TPA: helix-turn-helix transcriptional regulator [Anaerolineaceae bacterium]|nr:helix-turn-helix transcriptional regulator [Anaerolineaceae bacterium]
MEKKRPVLTIRQAQVLDRLRRGYSLKQIASQLVVGERTVRDHLRILKRKFGAESTAQLIALASQNQDLPPVEPRGGRSTEEEDFSTCGSA